METLLEHGANPNDSFEGYSVWQYWVHSSHEVVRKSPNWYTDHCRPRLERIFKLFLEKGVDVNVCCLQQACVWNRIFDIQGISRNGSTIDLEAHQHRMLSHGKKSCGSASGTASPPGMNNQAEEEQWKESHSLTAVIQEIFKTEEKPDGANELLELIAKLKADKERAGQVGSSVSQKKAPRRKKRRGKESKEVEKVQRPND
jgi:hypothetical protein